MIHVFFDGETFDVWSDCEAGEYKLGRCIGRAKNQIKALRQARKDLKRDLAKVERHLEQPLKIKIINIST